MLDRDVRNRVEEAFYNYERYKTMLEECSAVEVADENLAIQFDRVGRSNKISKPTEQKAIRLADNETAAKWIIIINKTLKKFKDTGKDTLIKLKYFSNCSEIKVMRRLYITRRETVYDWLTDILTYAAMLAIQERLVKIS